MVKYLDMSGDEYHPLLPLKGGKYFKNTAGWNRIKRLDAPLIVFTTHEASRIAGHCEERVLRRGNLLFGAPQMEIASAKKRPRKDAGMSQGKAWK